MSPRTDTDQHERPRIDNDHQKTVSGKKQHGPDEKLGYDAGGNAGSKGQNVDPRNLSGTGQEPGDRGDERHGGGSGGGQGNRQNRAVNRS